MTVSTPTRLPRNNFDFLRFAFASLVVLSHSYPLGTGNEKFEPLVLLSLGQLTLGTLAVDCFFIISGFLILHSWIADPKPLRYLRKRALRIYPAFLVVAFLDAFVVTPAFSNGGYQTIDREFVTRFALNALRLEASAPGPAFPTNPATGVNGSLWSISYEFWCYIGILALGLGGLALSRRLFAAALATTILISFVFSWRHLTPGGRILGEIFGYPPFWARLLPYFLVGMAFYTWRDRIRLNAKGAVFALLALTMGLSVPYGMIFVLPPAAAYLIFWIAFMPNLHLDNFARFGDVSYGIYLYSFPILQITAHFWGPPIPPLVLFFIGWPISIAVAALSWHLVEKHCIRIGRRPSTAVGH